MQGGTPNWAIECLFLFCDMSVSSASHILLMHTVPAGHGSEYRILSCTLCGQVPVAGTRALCFAQARAETAELASRAAEPGRLFTLAAP
jgi:hypothetical protein